jgi:hypothetical protein
MDAGMYSYGRLANSASNGYGNDGNTSTSHYYGNTMALAAMVAMTVTMATLATATEAAATPQQR